MIQKFVVVDATAVERGEKTSARLVRLHCCTSHQSAQTRPLFRFPIPPAQAAYPLLYYNQTQRLHHHQSILRAISCSRIVHPPFRRYEIVKQLIFCAVDQWRFALWASSAFRFGMVAESFLPELYVRHSCYTTNNNWKTIRETVCCCTEQRERAAVRTLHFCKTEQIINELHCLRRHSSSPSACPSTIGHACSWISAPEGHDYSFQR